LISPNDFRDGEVGARIVNKQRSVYGETQAEQEKDRQGRSPDRSLPIPGYQKLTIPAMMRELDGSNKRQLRSLRAHEARHKQRKAILAEFDRRLSRN
jgi:hypothetical protein